MTTNLDAAQGVPDTVTITHTFDAPRDLVWAAWTKNEHLVNWWGPDYFTNPTCAVDARPGGDLRIDMKGPDGTLYPMTGVFEEVIKPERLVFVTRPLNNAGNIMFEIRNTAVFSAVGDQTLLTLDAQVIATTPEAPQYLAGMEAGWKQSLGKLDRLLGSLGQEGAPML